MNIRLNRKKQSKAVNKTGRTAFSLGALHITHWFRGSVLIKMNVRKNMLQMRNPRRVHSTKTNFKKCLDINTLL